MRRGTKDAGVAGALLAALSAASRESRRPGPKTALAAMLPFLAGLMCLYFGSGRGGPGEAAVEAAEEVRQAPGGTAPAAKKPRRVDFKKFSDGQWVTGVGTVKRVLDDDTIPPRHQRFILEDEFGNTVLVAHNIDQAERVQGLKKGDEVAFRGEYRSNDSGGVIHWTHPDSSRRRQGGWLRKK